MTDQPHVPSTAVVPWRGEKPAIHTSIESPKEVLRVIADAIPGADALDKTIKLVHLVVHQATILQDDDTEVEAERTILVDDKGTGYAFVSAGILTSMRLLLGVVDQDGPPFDPPLPVKVTQKNTRRGRRIYRVILA